jgi:hypothetical protein
MDRLRNRIAVLAVLLAVVSIGGMCAATAADATKVQVAGVIDRQGAPTGAYQSVVNGWVVQVNWADLQPVASGPIVLNNPIDAAIANAHSLNAAHPGVNMRLKLRVYAGTGAPAWAKALGGSPLQLCERRASSCGSVGRFWTPAFGAAYADLQTKLAALYDGIDVVREVAIDRCTTLSAEPFLRQVNYAPNLVQYRSAGYNLAADQQCQRDEIDAHKVWAQTRSSLAFDPYTAVTATATYTDEVFTESMMDYCRASLGSQCVLGNNGLRDSDQGPDFDAMYNAIKARGAPIYFQTATYSRLHSLPATIQLALNDGAAMVELPVGYVHLSASQLAPLDTQLEARAST